MEHVSLIISLYAGVPQIKTDMSLGAVRMLLCFLNDPRLCNCTYYLNSQSINDPGVSFVFSFETGLVINCDYRLMLYFIYFSDVDE